MHGAQTQLKSSPYRVVLYIYMNPVGMDDQINMFGESNWDCSSSLVVTPMVKVM